MQNVNKAPSRMDMVLGILRNPYGHSSDEIRQARLDAADYIEKTLRILPAEEGRWVAVSELVAIKEFLERIKQVIDQRKINL